MPRVKNSETTTPSRLTVKDEGGSFLPDGGKKDERKRRGFEQRGHRKWARVNEKERAEQEVALDGELQQEAEVHPYFMDTQKFDGIFDAELTPLLPDNPEARRDLENKLRLQHQLRLSKNKEFQFSPKPQV